MEHLNFDLISDLYIDNHPGDIDWNTVRTSLLAVVAGDVSSDLDRVTHELTRISNSYRQVIYIDGDLENRDYPDDQAGDYLERKLRKIRNCLYLRGNVVVFNNTAFIGANLGWVPWGKDINDDDVWDSAMADITKHHRDLNYLKNTVHRMQMTNDVHQIAIISHTVPNTALVEPFPDVDYENIGSNASDIVDAEDITNKLQTWCFGHYHRPIDETVNGIRYVSNPRGKPGQGHGFSYYPKRVVL